MKKVVVCGPPGSGKTTFAKKLSEISGINVIHADGARYVDKTTHRSDEELREYIRTKLTEDSWILDGCSGCQLSNLSDKVDHIYLCELPRFTRLQNLIKRVWKNGGQLPDDFSNHKQKIYNLKFFYRMIFKVPRRQKAVREVFLSAPKNVRCVYVNSFEKYERILKKARQRYESHDDHRGWTG